MDFRWIVTIGHDLAKVAQFIGVEQKRSYVCDAVQNQFLEQMRRRLSDELRRGAEAHAACTAGCGGGAIAGRLPAILIAC